MSLPVKLGVSTLALGSAVGVGYGAINYFSQENKENSINKPQTKSVTDLIKEKYEYILLNFSEEDDKPDKDHWENIWRDYQSANTTGTNVLNLEGWTTRSNTDFTNKIKQKCSQLSSSMVLNEQEKTYKDITKYCSRPVTLADEAGNDGFTIIETKDEKNENTHWQPKVDKKETLIEQLKKLGLSTNASLTAKNVREKCRDIATKKKQEEEYKDTLVAYKAVCANPKEQQ